MSTFISPMKNSTKRRPINHIISCPLSRKRRTNKPVTFEIRTWRWPFRGEIPSSCSVFARQQLSRFRGSGFSVFLSLSLSLSLFIYLSMSPCLCISLSLPLSRSQGLLAPSNCLRVCWQQRRMRSLRHVYSGGELRFP